MTRVIFRTWSFEIIDVFQLSGCAAWHHTGVINRRSWGFGTSCRQQRKVQMTPGERLGFRPGRAVIERMFSLDTAVEVKAGFIKAPRNQDLDVTDCLLRCVAASSRRLRLVRDGTLPTTASTALRVQSLCSSARPLRLTKAQFCSHRASDLCPGHLTGMLPLHYTIENKRLGAVPMQNTVTNLAKHGAAGLSSVPLTFAGINKPIFVWAHYF